MSDVTDKLGVLLYEVGELEDMYVDHHDQFRVTIKSIRNIEASVQPSRDREYPRRDICRVILTNIYSRQTKNHG